MTTDTSTSLKKAIVVYCFVALFLFYEMGIQVSPGIITKELMFDFNTNALGLGIMSGFFYYSYTIMQIPAGLLYDRFNIRLVLTIPVALCALGALLFSVADSLFLGSIGRLLMGVGGAFAFIGVLVVISDLFPIQYFPFFVGLTQLLAAFGAMFGGLPLIPFIDNYGWRSTMCFLGVVGLVLAGLIWYVTHYPKKQKEDLQAKNTIRQSLKLIISNLQTWYIAIYACVLWAPMAAFASLWGIPFLETVYDLNNTQAAFLNSLMWIGLALGSLVLGGWSSHLQRRRLPLLIASFIGLIAFSVLLLGFPLSNFYLGILIFLAGAACAGQAISFSVIKDINSLQTMGTAIGFNNMAVVVSGAIFQPLIGKLIQSHCSGKIVEGVPSYSASDYQSGLTIIAVCYAIGLVMCLFFIKETGKGSKQSSQFTRTN